MGLPLARACRWARAGSAARARPPRASPEPPAGRAWRHGTDEHVPAQRLRREPAHVRERRREEQRRVGAGERARDAPDVGVTQPERHQEGQDGEPAEPRGEATARGARRSLEPVERHEAKPRGAPAADELGDRLGRLLPASRRRGVALAGRLAGAVVEQQDLAAAHPGAGAIRDRRGARPLRVPDAARPRDEHEAASPQGPAEQRRLEAVRRAEERRRLDPRRADRGGAAVELRREGGRPREVELHVAVAVLCDEVPTPGRLAHELGGRLGGAAEHEEGGLHAGAVEGVEHRARVRPRPIVEGEGDLGAIAAPGAQARPAGIERRPQRVGGGRGEREGDRREPEPRKWAAAHGEERGAAEEGGERGDGDREEGLLAERHRVPGESYTTARAITRGAAQAAPTARYSSSTWRATRGHAYRVAVSLPRAP